MVYKKYQKMSKSVIMFFKSKKMNLISVWDTNSVNLLLKFGHCNFWNPGNRTYFLFSSSFLPVRVLRNSYFPVLKTMKSTKHSKKRKKERKKIYFRVFVSNLKIKLNFVFDNLKVNFKQMYHMVLFAQKLNILFHVSIIPV